LLENLSMEKVVQAKLEPIPELKPKERKVLI
jgi:hypothetical protein